MNSKNLDKCVCVCVSLCVSASFEMFGPRFPKPRYCTPSGLGGQPPRTPHLITDTPSCPKRSPTYDKCSGRSRGKEDPGTSERSSCPVSSGSMCSGQKKNPCPPPLSRSPNPSPGLLWLAGDIVQTRQGSCPSDLTRCARCRQQRGATAAGSGVVGRWHGAGNWMVCRAEAIVCQSPVLLVED